MTNPPEIDFDNWSCPVPLRSHPHIVMGHGGGGKLSAELVEHLFKPAFSNEWLDELGDTAVFQPPLPTSQTTPSRLAFSTDSFVVRPLFFPGGNIGELAINGTVNDIAMSGAVPLYLSVGFIIEEGLSIELLGRVVESMARAAQIAGVKIITGDTKVVDKGHGDGLYINTSGVGILPDNGAIQIGPRRAQPGDLILLSGTIGDHGMAVMSVREGLSFETEIVSDTAALNHLIAAMLAATPHIHVLRDPTRGGVASSLNEIAAQSQVGMVLEETAIPVNTAVASACELLGLDPLFVANEGKLIAIVPESEAEKLLAVMQAHPLGKNTAVVGHVTDQHAGMVVARTPIGGTRVVAMQIGEQLPRIC